MPRGGKRSGAPGKAYSNRSDLNGPQPIGNFAKSGPYGTGVSLTDAQKALPVAGAPMPQQGAPQVLQPGGPPADQGPPGPLPGSFGAFNRPTERPYEPITHGLPTGPGGGPEVLPAPVAKPAQTVLQQMASSPFASDEIRALANLMPR